MSTFRPDGSGQAGPPEYNTMESHFHNLSLQSPAEAIPQNKHYATNALESPFSAPHLAPAHNKHRTKSLRLNTTPEALNETYQDYVSRPAGSGASGSTLSRVNSAASNAAGSNATVSNSTAGPVSPQDSATSPPLSAVSPRGRGSVSGGQAADMQARILALQRSRSRQGASRSMSNTPLTAPSGSMLSRRSSSSSSTVGAQSMRRPSEQNDSGEDELATPTFHGYKITNETDPSATEPASSAQTSPSHVGTSTTNPLPASVPPAPQADNNVPAMPTASNGFDPNTVISPTAMTMAAGGLPISLSRASSFRTRQRSSLSARRGMKLDMPSDQGSDNPRAGPGGAAGGTAANGDSATGRTHGGPAGRGPVSLGAGFGVSNNSLGPGSVNRSILGAGEKGNRGLFRDYRKYIDIESGSLNFAGKACVHAHGIEFSSGEKFDISMDKLEFICEIGSGNYGTVQKLLHAPNNVLMAVKEIRLELDEASLRQIIMELDVLHRCNVDSIIAFYGAFFVEGSVYICMEYMDGGSINKIYQGGVPEKYLKYIVRAVVSGLKELKEDFNIIHRDVKPTNILCSTDGQIKLCDFGVSGNLVASIARTNIGCQAYMAPERIKGDPTSNGGNPNQGMTYTAESDIWSLGLSIIEMAKGSYPYPSDSFQSIFSQLNAIVEDPAPALDPTKYSPEACDFVRRLLSKSPAERPRYSDIVKHPWLATVECTREEMGEFVKQRVAMQEESGGISPEQPTMIPGSLG